MAGVIETVVEHLTLERADRVAVVTIDRAEARNTLTFAMYDGLHDLCGRLDADPAVRAVILRGAGDKAFASGTDIRQFQSFGTRDDALAYEARIGRVLTRIHGMSKPTLAMIQGDAIGGGLFLALACDLRVAAAGARFGLPEVRVGVPSVIHAALLPPLVGPGRAAELLLTGATIDAEQALAWGLVNRVVAPAGLAAAVDALVDTLTACAPTAVRLQKELIVRWRESELPAAVRAGIAAFAAAYRTGEPREGAAAFLEKRPPRFEGPR